MYNNDLKKDYKNHLIFIMGKIHKYTDLDISNGYLQKKYINPVDYLNILKKIFLLNNPVEPNHEGKVYLLEIINRDEYVIKIVNFKKMILILYRITAKIPIILMGKKGFGKTFLIRKLNQLLNDGNETIKIININPTYNDKKLVKRTEEINKRAKIYKGKELWLFFDELNTCDFLVLITEIFMNISYNGEKLEDNKNEFIMNILKNEEFDFDLCLLLKDYISFYFHKYEFTKNDSNLDLVL